MQPLKAHPWANAQAPFLPARGGCLGTHARVAAGTSTVFTAGSSAAITKEWFGRLARGACFRGAPGWWAAILSAYSSGLWRDWFRVWSRRLPPTHQGRIWSPSPRGGTSSPPTAAEETLKFWR